MPTVRVVIPAYNAERFLTDCVRSLQTQTFSDWEAVIIDDCSTDSTLAVAAQVTMEGPRFRVLGFDVNRGQSAARNAGLVLAETKYALFLDADDTLESDALAKLVSVANANPGFCGAHGRCRLTHEDGAFLTVQGAPVGGGGGRFAFAAGRLRRLAPHEPTAHEAIVVGCWPPTGATLLRSSALTYESEQHPEWGGPWRPGVKIWEDRDLWVRLTRAAPLGFIDAPLLRYRQHAGSTMASVNRQGAMIELRAILGVVAQDDEERALFVRGSQANERRLAKAHVGGIASSIRGARLLEGARQLYRAGRSYGRSFGLFGQP